MEGWELQKKLRIILLIYILILCLGGGILALKQRIDKFPILEQALIEDIIQQEGMDILSPDSNNNKNSPGSAEDLGKDDTPNYWGNDNTNGQNNKDKKSILKEQNLKISTTDKLKVMYLLKRNLSSEEINLMISMAKDGLTNQEKGEIIAILRRKLDQDDKDQLKTIVMKYLAHNKS
jgi:hypothetical protein